MFVRKRKAEGLPINVHDVTTVKESLRLAVLRHGSKRKRHKPDVSVLAEDSVDRQTGRATWREKKEDRESDRYTEKVTDKETGAEIVNKDERLSDHQRRGSAKKPCKPKEPKR